MTVGLVVGVLVVHNLVTNLWFIDRGYVPVNLATAGLLVWLVGPEGLGLHVGWVPLAVGGAGAVVVLGLVGLIAWVPATRPLLADQRMAGVDARGTAWRAVVRIPRGTVVLEEVAFRGVLPSLMPAAVAAVLFGLWHIVPTARTLDVNGVARSWSARVAVLGGAVVVTTVVGLVFWELREATGSLVAPALVHGAANSGATIAAFVVLRSASTPAPADLLPDVTAEQAEEEAS